MVPLKRTGLFRALTDYKRICSNVVGSKSADNADSDRRVAVKVLAIGRQVLGNDDLGCLLKMEFAAV